MAAMARLAVVSGGTRGLGRGIAFVLATQGHRVAVLGRCPDAAAAAAASLPLAAGVVGHVGLACDVRQTAAVDAAMVEATMWGGPPWVVVSAAGVNHDGLLAGRLADEKLEEMIDTNLLGSLRLCRAAARAMLRSRVWGGSIVNVGSVVGG